MMATRFYRAILCMLLFLSNTSYANEIDQRAADAADVFNGLCVQTFMRKEPNIDLKRFAVALMGPSEIAKWRPSLQVETATWVAGFGNDGEMVVYYDKKGICAVEVKRANQTAMEQSFDSRLNNFSEKNKYTISKVNEQTNDVNGNNVKSISWNIDTPDGQALIMLSTSSLQNVRVQHIITISFASK